MYPLGLLEDIHQVALKLLFKYFQKNLAQQSYFFIFFILQSFFYLLQLLYPFVFLETKIDMKQSQDLCIFSLE